MEYDPIASVAELLFIVRRLIKALVSSVTINALFGGRRAAGMLTISPEVGGMPVFQCKESDQLPLKFEPLACQIVAITAVYAAAPAGVSGIRAPVAPGRTLRSQHPPRA